MDENPYQAPAVEPSDANELTATKTRIRLRDIAWFVFAAWVTISIVIVAIDAIIGFSKAH